jgi:DNA-binding CsgD family transcriptional regulator/PAS domain-containing protein
VTATSIRFEAGELSRLIGLGYEAAIALPAWRVLANDVAAATGSRMAMIQYIEDDHPERSFLVCGGLGSDFEEVFAETSWLSEDDRFWADIRNRPSGTVRLSHEIMAAAEMRKTPAYSRLAKPWKLEHFLISAVQNGNGVSAFLSLGRASGEPPFVDGDKKLFSELLLSHLQRSITFHRVLQNSQQRDAALSALVDTTPYGVVVFDNRGRPLIVNKRASGIFGSGQGLGMVNGRLHAADPEAHARLENALSMAVHSALGALIPAPDPVMVPRRGRLHPYQVVFSRLTSGDGAHDLPVGSSVVAMIHEEWLSGPKYLATMLRSTYGLTSAEVRLCQAMLEGKSLSEAASDTRISRNTAKTHLSRVFNKTGVRSQSALLRLLSAGIRPKLPILNIPSTGGSRAPP